MTATVFAFPSDRPVRMVNNISSATNADCLNAASGTGLGTVVPLPLLRRSALVGRAAHWMRGMSAPMATDYLIVLLEHLQGELRGIGIDQSTIDDELIAFALAVKAAARSGLYGRPGDVA